MKYIAFLIIFNTFLWSANLTKHIISESEDRVDIMLYFDTPYNKQIIKKRDSKSTILIILPQVNSKYKISNHINSQIIQSFKAISYKNQTLLELKGFSQFRVEEMSTIDHYGLRLRVKPLLEANEKQLYPNKRIVQNRTDKLTTKDASDITSTSIKVLLAIFWVFAALFLLKTWIVKKRDKDLDLSSWFPKKTEVKKEIKEIKKVKEEKKEPTNIVVVEVKKEEPKKEEPKKEEPKKEEPKKEEPKKEEPKKEEPKKEEPKKTTEIIAKPKQETPPPPPPPEDPFNIVFQKHIDKQNTVSLLEYNGNNYLILTGNTNMLLEMNAKTQKGVPINDTEIRQILEQNDKNFNDFIQLQNRKFNEYKRKASQDAPIKIGASS